MLAASYREGPDGHSSRKQNSKRRRAKCSPSFVSGCAIGHGGSSPRCIPECSAMALHRAVPAARPSRASTLSFVLLAWRSPSPAFGAVFFAGRAAVIWCGANPGVRPWQDLRECVPRRPTVAGLRPDALLAWLAVAIYLRSAFPSVYLWQVLRSMHPKRGLGRENRPFLARFARHASETSWLWQDMRAMYPKSPANRRWRIHRANILPGRGPFRCTGTSNHARRADLAIRRRRTTLAPATSVPPNSASRPQSQHRPHSAAALGTCHPAQRQTALAPATPAAPKRNSGANRAVNDPAPRISGSAQHCSGERVRGAARRRSASR